MLGDLIGSLFRLLFYLLFFGGMIAVVLYILRSERPRLDQTISHWHSSIPHLEGTPNEFYKQVAELVKEQEMPGVVTKVVSWHEGGVFSDRRDYLRIRWGEYTYDICLAPFAKSLFVSAWLSENPRNFLTFVSTLPFLSWWVLIGRRLFAPETYYKVDSARMFQGAVHSSLLRVLDQMITAQSLDPLPESERKPVMRALYKDRDQGLSLA